MELYVLPVRMEVRTVTPEDGDAVRDVARRSLEASYPLQPTTIESAVEQWYDNATLAEKLADDASVFLAVEDGGEVVGFAESVVAEDAEDADLLWLHVAPAARGQGAGEALFEAVRDRLAERGVANLRGRVLADNADGNDFYQRHGFVKAGETEVEIDGTPHVENVYVEEAAPLEPFQGPDGEDLYVDGSDTEHGSQGQFAAVYRDRDRARRYGYRCLNCGSLVTTMDTMGRMECDQCGNVRKPTRWDAAYL